MMRFIINLLSQMTGLREDRLFDDWFFFRVTHRMNGKRANFFVWLQNILDLAPALHNEKLTEFYDHDTR